MAKVDKSTVGTKTAYHFHGLAEDVVINSRDPHIKELTGFSRELAQKALKHDANGKVLKDAQGKPVYNEGWNAQAFYQQIHDKTHQIYGDYNKEVEADLEKIRNGTVTGEELDKKLKQRDQNPNDGKIEIENVDKKGQLICSEFACIEQYALEAAGVEAEVFTGLTEDTKDPHMGHAFVATNDGVVEGTVAEGDNPLKAAPGALNDMRKGKPVAVNDSNGNVTGSYIPKMGDQKHIFENNNNYETALNNQKQKSQTPSSLVPSSPLDNINDPQPAKPVPVGNGLNDTETVNILKHLRDPLNDPDRPSHRNPDLPEKYPSHYNGHEIVKNGDSLDSQTIRNILNQNPDILRERHEPNPDLKQKNAPDPKFEGLEKYGIGQIAEQLKLAGVNAGLENKSPKDTSHDLASNLRAPTNIGEGKSGGVLQV